MKFKVGQSVKVIAGDAKGKTGTILKLLRTRKGRTLSDSYTHVVVEGVNERQRNRKPMMGESGRVVTLTKKIHISNVSSVKEVKKSIAKAKDGSKILKK